MTSFSKSYTFPQTCFVVYNYLLPVVWWWYVDGGKLVLLDFQKAILSHKIVCNQTLTFMYTMIYVTIYNYAKYTPNHIKWLP